MSDTTDLSQAVSPLAPHLICDGAAAAIDFYVAAFGATELLRMPGEDGKLMHGAILVNGATVMLVDANPAWGLLSPKALGGSPVTLHLTVPDVDAFIAHAVEAGAELTGPPADMFWGDRYGTIRDPFGHNWSIATPLPGAPRTAEELREAAKGAQCGEAVGA